MNQMIAALQKSRAAEPVAPEDNEVPAPVDPREEEAPEDPGEMLIEKLSAIEEKIDKLCAAMKVGAEDAQDEESAPDAQEVVPNDDGY